MNLPLPTVLALTLGSAAYGLALYRIDRSLSGASRAVFRYVAVAVTLAAFVLALRRYVDDFTLAADWCKGAVAALAVMAVFYEAFRAGVKRPIAERWKKFVGVSLAVAAICGYFHGGNFGYPKYYHRWELFHYYVGAKYFRQLGYDGLYKCTAVAEDELGAITWNDDDTGRPLHADLTREVRAPDKKIRNLGGDNLLMPVTEVLAHPETCKAPFTAARWDAFKADVRFFRSVSDKGYWEDMQKDHGYNPPPTWTVLGRFFAELHPATVLYCQGLAMLDIAYLAGMFGALWWAFGWRVSALGAIFWGCQSPAPFFWTGGAFLRQDWLFFLVLSACLMRRRWHRLSGAAMVYAGLLRIFPGLVVIGWLALAAWQLVRTRSLTRAQRSTLAGGLLGAAVLVPLSLAVCGPDAFQQFYEHTLKVHDQTPLTNHMGLRVLVAHKAVDAQLGWPPVKVADGASSGRMKYVRDNKLNDPFEVWKRMRLERYARYRGVAYAVVGLTLVLFAAVTRRLRSLWVAQCLAQVFVVLLSQLTCYYYSFLILGAPLTKAKRQLEIPLLGLALLSQPTFDVFGYNDDKYTALTLLVLAFCYGLLCAFLPKGFWDGVWARVARRGAAGPA